MTLAHYLSTMIVVAAYLCGDHSLLAITVDGREMAIEYETGDGPLTSYLVIDFSGGSPPGGTYAFAYHHDGQARGIDMLRDLADAGELEFEATISGGGAFIDSFGYRSEFDRPDFSVDERFWGYWTSAYDPADGGRLAWEFSSQGVSDRALAGESFDGWIALGDRQAPAVPLFLLADLNRDGAIDAADAGLMFAAWGTDGVGDLTRDAIVDAADAGILFEDWTGEREISARGRVSSAGIDVVPEPSNLLFAGLCVLGVVAKRLQVR